MRTFEYAAYPARVIFGAGTLRQLPDEVRHLGASRVLLLAGTNHDGPARRATELLGPLAVARFAEVTMHTPVEVTGRALELLRAHGADCLVSLGGGSATGLGKALALRTGLPQIAVPTTYAGSEVTPVLGETAEGGKTTRTDPAVLPRTVLYDVELTLDLPVDTSVTSGVNALAHAVEALYSPGANPLTDRLAEQAIARMSGALPRIVAGPSTVDGRADALLAAWLAGVCLGTVGMGLHHKLCHTLGGSFDLPHAPTHAVVLPHAMAYNASAAPEAMARVAAALGVKDAPAGMYDLIAALHGPVSLRELGLAESDIGKAAELATELAAAQPYPNPREVTRDGVEHLLRAAWRGERPIPRTPDFGWLTRDVLASFDGAPRTHRLVTELVRHLHEFVVDNDVTEAEWQYGIDFLTRTGHLSGDRRQEFILLSDVLGVSSMVDLLTNSRTPDTTPSAVLGPFYVDGPPVMDDGADLAAGLPGTPLWTDVRVVDPDGQPVAGATVDVWQSNADGFYDVQLPDLHGPALRGRFHTRTDGGLAFWSILPSAYPIPGDGPVGQLLDATGRHHWRAPHLHFLISAPGYRRLVTQLFVAGGDHLDSDSVFGVKDDLIVDFVPRRGPTPDGRRVDGEWRLLEYTFRIAPATSGLPGFSG